MSVCVYVFFFVLSLSAGASCLELWELCWCFDSVTDFVLGGLSDVSLAKYCPQYLLTDFPRAHVITNRRLTQEHHQGDICR